VEFHPDLSLIIFDFDGTLFDLAVDWDGLRRELGVVPGGPETLGDAIQRLAATGDPLLDRVTAAEVAGVGARRIAPEVGQLLGRLSRHVALAICTRNSRHAVDRALSGVPGVPGGDQLVVVGREDVRRLKPDPEALQRALDRTGATGEGTLVVGDTYHDVQAARAIGARAAVVANPRLARRPEGADYYVDRLIDLMPLLTNGEHA
jgi:phosphoglycolate phosphatase-like HAD superfamily hydrolase